jgi:hypothetical protein
MANDYKNFVHATGLIAYILQFKQHVQLQVDIIKRKLTQHFSQDWARKNAVCWLAFLFAYDTVFPRLIFWRSSIQFYLLLPLAIPSLIVGPIFSMLLFLRLIVYGVPAKPVSFPTAPLEDPEAGMVEASSGPKLRVRVFTRGLEQALVNSIMHHNIGVLKEIG